MRRRSLRAVALITALGALPACATEFLGRHVWEPDWRGAGGFSALWLASDGAGFVALSDRGVWVEGRLSRGESGAVTDVEVSARGDLLRSTGGALREGETDAEGIARVADTFFISYEGEHRVMRHATLGAPPERMPRPRDFQAFQSNSGLEALAADAEGRLYAIPERSRGNGGKPLPIGARGVSVPEGEDHPFPVYRLDGDRWTVPFRLPRRGPWLVSGADFGPDGRLYVLERDFAVIGFRSRIRSFAADGGDERLEMESGLRSHDNLEGISVWRDAQGRLRATLLSDDNLRGIQVTEFVDYVLSEPTPPVPKG